MKQNHTVGTLTLIQIIKKRGKKHFSRKTEYSLKDKNTVFNFELILNLEKTQFDDTSYWIILF